MSRKKEIVTGRALHMAVCLLVLGGAATAPTIMHSFDGDKGPGLAVCALHLGYDKNGICLCGGHLGDSNPNTIEGVAYDCLAVAMAEVRAIAQGKAPTHVSRVHSMPLDVFPVIDHNRNKAPGAPAFFVAMEIPVGSIYPTHFW